MPEAAGNSEVDFIPRAARYAVRMPMRYRASGEVSWRDGTTENISRSGIAFRGEQVLEPATSVEMTLALPVEIAGEQGANVFCRGLIVRAALPQVPGERPALAATIEEFGFVRAPRASLERGL